MNHKKRKSFRKRRSTYMRKTIHQLEKRALPFHDLIRGIVMIESFSLFWFELDIKTQLKSHSTVSFQGN